MGVDVGIKIKMYDASGESKLEIEVSSQDNSLGSILDGSSEIRYLSVVLHDENFLTPEEFAKIRLRYHPEEEMLMVSKLIDSNEAVIIFEKIFQITSMKIPAAIQSDLSRIDGLNIDDRDKSERKNSQIGAYVGFEYSLGVVIGVLKVASVIYPKVQIVGEYY